MVGVWLLGDTLHYTINGTPLGDTQQIELEYGEIGKVAFAVSLQRKGGKVTLVPDA